MDLACKLQLSSVQPKLLFGVRYKTKPAAANIEWKYDDEPFFDFSQ